MKSLGGLIRPNTRGLMQQLLLINVIVIMMDIALLGMEYASEFLAQVIAKGVFYSIKLKLELAILGRLVKFVRSEAGEFVEMRSPSSRSYS